LPSLNTGIIMVNFFIIIELKNKLLVYNSKVKLNKSNSF